MQPGGLKWAHHTAHTIASVHVCPAMSRQPRRCVVQVESSFAVTSHQHQRLEGLARPLSSPYPTDNARPAAVCCPATLPPPFALVPQKVTQTSVSSIVPASAPSGSTYAPFPVNSWFWLDKFGPAHQGGIQSLAAEVLSGAPASLNTNPPGAITAALKVATPGASWDVEVMAAVFNHSGAVGATGGLFGGVSLAPCNRDMHARWGRPPAVCLVALLCGPERGQSAYLRFPSLAQPMYMQTKLSGFAAPSHASTMPLLCARR